MRRCVGPCGRHLGKHYGRGLCASCHGRARRSGELIDYPRVTRSADETLDEWDRLRRAGVLRAEAAQRMDMRLETLERMLYRYRDDPRARLGQRRELHFRARDEVTGQWVSAA